MKILKSAEAPSEHQRQASVEHRNRLPDAVRLLDPEDFQTRAEEFLMIIAWMFLYLCLSRYKNSNSANLDTQVDRVCSWYAIFCKKFVVLLPELEAELNSLNPGRTTNGDP